MAAFTVRPTTGILTFENRKLSKQMNIRSYEIPDLERIGFLFDEFIILNATLTYRDNCRSIYLNWLRSIYGKSDYNVLVAEQKGEVIAFAVGMIQSNKPLLLPQRIGYIGMFVVHSKLRRRGIGSSLYKRLLDWFASNQIKELQLATEVNNDLAKAFWNDHGFITTYEQKTLKL
ncbi:MAG: GNAT family N-acetyltransferase [Desulfobacteraceae bacterium]|jgi:ribosomal protein S18 acetylase RimI-like enzyme